MQPEDLLPDTPVYTRPPLRLQAGTIRARVLSTGALSVRGSHAIVDFPDGTSPVLAHWQLERQGPAEPARLVSVCVEQQATQPAPEPGSCKPIRASWKDDIKLGAVYFSQHPSGLLALSLVLMRPDGTSKQVVRLVDLDTEEFADEAVRMAIKVAKIVTELQEQA